MNKGKQKSRDSHGILDSDGQESDADDNDESIVGTERTESLSAPLADAIDNEQLNAAETPVIVATVRIVLSLF